MPSNANQEKIKMVMSISMSISPRRAKNITNDKERHYIILKRVN